MATWMEKALEEYKTLLLKDYCPLDKLVGAPKVAFETSDRIFKDRKIIGCRGITCEQCWNQESEE